MQPTAEQIAAYEGCCALCKYFRGAYQRNDERDTIWLDDEGWCVRFPPVFVGGDMDDTNECDTGRYKQPGVWGSDECGEWVRAMDVPNAKSEGAGGGIIAGGSLSTDGFDGGNHGGREMKRATTLLAMAAAMTVAMPYQMRAIRRIEKGESTAGDLERIAKAEAKRARKNAKRRRPKMNFVFLSGDGNPLPGMDASDRRFMVVMDDVEPPNK